MLREVKFESQDRREKQVLAALNANGIASIEEANQICEQYGLDPYMTCEETQRICFENAKWAYVVGSAIALKKGCTNAADAAEAIGIGEGYAAGKAVEAIGRQPESSGAVTKTLLIGCAMAETTGIYGLFIGLARALL